jgi:hypothetical protein
LEPNIGSSGNEIVALISRYLMFGVRFLIFTSGCPVPGVNASEVSEFDSLNLTFLVTNPKRNTSNFFQISFAKKSKLHFKRKRSDGQVQEQCFRVNCCDFE